MKIAIEIVDLPIKNRWISPLISSPIFSIKKTSPSAFGSSSPGQRSSPPPLDSAAALETPQAAVFPLGDAKSLYIS